MTQVLQAVLDQFSKKLNQDIKTLEQANQADKAMQQKSDELLIEAIASLGETISTDCCSDVIRNLGVIASKLNPKPIWWQDQAIILWTYHLAPEKEGAKPRTFHMIVKIPDMEGHSPYLCFAEPSHIGTLALSHSQLHILNRDFHEKIQNILQKLKDPIYFAKLLIEIYSGNHNPITNGPPGVTDP